MANRYRLHMQCPICAWSLQSNVPGTPDDAIAEAKELHAQQRPTCAGGPFKLLTIPDFTLDLPPTPPEGQS